MGRPCTCMPCTVCNRGQCDCTCEHGPHLKALDLYELRKRWKDMTPKQRKDFVKELEK